MVLGETASGRKGINDFFINLVIRCIISFALCLPYRIRVPIAGWVVSRIISPIAGYSNRIRENLKTVLPNLSKEEVELLVVEVPNNAGRTLIEIFSGKTFIKRVSNSRFSGPGLKELEKAHTENRPVVLVTGHFGNYDAPRAALISKGFNVGALYRKMNNGYFNSYYEKAITEIGSPIFPRGRKGLSDLIKFLRSGGMGGFLIDQHMGDGEELKFFGKSARTALSAAELALKYHALVIPIYGVRLPNGLDFNIVCESPIKHSTPEQMTQELNDSLEKIVRLNMAQWFWIHRRWKPERE